MICVESYLEAFEKMRAELRAHGLESENFALSCVEHQLCIK